MSQLEEHHYEVIVTTRDGVLIDFDLNDEKSATWHEGTVYLPTQEKWGNYSEYFDDDVANDAMTAIVRQAKRRIPVPVGSYCILWAGHILDAFATEREAEQAAADLVVEVNAGKVPDFLDPEDIEDMDDPFPVRWMQDVS